jgi:hypothetical protein
MKAAATRQLAAQRMRWERMHVAIRCGLHATQPVLIRVYLGIGRRLAQQGLLDDVTANQRMLCLLLDTARDNALPWFWRSVCLEHTAMPVARLTTLLERQDPGSLKILETGLRTAQMQLAAEAPSQSPRRADA